MPERAPPVARAALNDARDGANGTGTTAGDASRASMSPGELAGVLLEAFRTLLYESESYVQYFEQRYKLEEEHVRALKSMLEKQRELDLRINRKLAAIPGMLPEVNSYAGLRNTWGDMRLSEMWAVDMRLKTLVAWRGGTLQPILQFRDAQERIRRRVKEDLRACVDEYVDMRDTTLPRIRRAYEKKCEELEFYRQQQHAIEEQRALLASPTHVSPPPRPAPPPPRSRPASDQLLAPPPLDKSPLPSSPGGTEEPSYFAHAGSQAAATSPGSTHASGRFLDTLRKKDGWDAAPKKLNALFSRMLDSSMDRGAHDGIGAVAAPPPAAGPEAAPDSGALSVVQKSQQFLAVKLAKCRREMEDADRAYRKAVFDLETLRIRRNKVLAAAASSLLDWRRELSDAMHKVCVQHAQDNLAMRASLDPVLRQDEQVATHMLDHLETEQQHCEERLPSARSLADDEPMQYVNYWHGPYKDLIFGTGLVDYAFSHNEHAAAAGPLSAAQPPLIVSKCINFMGTPAHLQTPGIYRLSAKYSRIQEVTSAIERDEASFQFSEREEPALVASILKQYLRQLPEPVMATRREERVKYTHERDEHIRSGFAIFKSRIRRMPPIHQATLRALVMHLAQVARESEMNKMTASNLALIFSPVVLAESDAEATSIAAVTEEDRTMEDLIVYCDEIFGSTARHTPLPPVPTEAADDEGAVLDDAQPAPHAGELEAVLPATPPGMDAHEGVRVVDRVAD
ncbi:hypothetical protein MSPP1_000442 [Malassezia sp. CBS 17886]|nr:hypothetical protein MSPP1_000442 [Malassezia sp. CBS 17886]